jgi:release factor glutamine methyltransferase
LILNTKAPTLIPRPETSHIISLLADRILNSTSGNAGELRVADICTGSGCIALLLAHLLRTKLGTITGYDISNSAIELARDNAKKCNLEDKVTFRQGDIWDDGMISERVDMVVSNPPYIPRSQWDILPPGVKIYEDPRALIGDPAGLPDQENGIDGIKEGDGKGFAFYRRIAEILPDILVDQGSLSERGFEGLPRVAVEVGMGQAEDVREILRASGLQKTEIWEDQYQVQRMVVGWNYRPKGML